MYHSNATGIASRFETPLFLGSLLGGINQTLLRSIQVLDVPHYRYYRLFVEFRELVRNAARLGCMMFQQGRM